MLHPRSAQAGFSFIELVIAMAIVGILLAVGMPSYRTWIENSKLRNAAESVQSGLTLARSEAITRNAPVEIRLLGATSSAWEVGCQPSSATCPALIQQRAASEGSSGKVTVASGSGRTIRFNSLGRMTLPVPAAGTTINIDVDTTALASGASRDLRIVVDIGGSIRMCDTSVTDNKDPRRC